ncbi:MAG: 1,4-alpha-glucan branching protein domain-containing protein, partial [Candidatus Hermodarchaeota archaeon]
MLGSYCLVLHSHIPWVLGHGIWPHGTSWLNEAVAETYIPLLQELHKLIDNGYHPKLTIGLTPVLCEMLRHQSFIEEFTTYLDDKLASALHDYDDFTYNKYEEGRIRLTQWWEEFYERVRDDYIHRYNRDIIGAFKKLQDDGLLDIITCGATHGYNPLLSKDTSIDAQFKTAVDNYKNHFGRAPTGTWLPECGYRPGYRWKNPLNPEEEYDRPGIEYFLAKNGLKYFFIDTALLLGGKSQGVYAARFPLLKELWKQFAAQYEELPISFEKSQYEVYLVSTRSAEAPVGFFTRDEKTGIVVWSGEHGYPGCAEYLDFHKKHYPGGLRYWKVTGAKIDLGKKMLYWPEDVPNKLNENASHYIHLAKDILREHKNKFGNQGIIVAPYDCELFGHWWFEGTWWLARVLRWMEDDPEIELTNTRIFVDKNPPNKVCQIIEGSWGQGSSHWVWMNEWTTWTWEKIYECEAKSEEIIAKYKESADEHLLKILKQMARELLLLESSDWQFLITTWSARDYAENRVALHYDNFNRLHKMAETYGNGAHVDEGEWNFLGMLEANDGIFMDLDLEPF